VPKVAVHDLNGFSWQRICDGKNKNKGSRIEKKGWGKGLLKKAGEDEKLGSTIEDSEASEIFRVGVSITG